MKQRVSAVIVENKKILLIRRVKPGEEYYVFPGGSVEGGENLTHTMWREIKEELSVNANIGRLLFKVVNKDQEEHFFLINSFIGKLEIGGPEKMRMSNDNQYHIEWVNSGILKDLQNLYPIEAREKLVSMVFI